jgi:hypothetical protein
VPSPVTDELVADDTDAGPIGGTLSKYNVTVLLRMAPVGMSTGTLEAVVGVVRWMIIGLS